MSGLLHQHHITKERISIYDIQHCSYKTSQLIFDNVIIYRYTYYINNKTNAP